MITKDIVLAEKNVQSKIAKSESIDGERSHRDEIDDIFESADIAMQKKTSKIKINKKKKKRPFLFGILKFLLITAVVIGLLVFIGIKYTQMMYPEIKQAFITEYIYIQEELRELDDATLSEEEYYQKQILLLVTPEELDSAIDSVFDINQLKNIFNEGGTFDTSLIPQEKIDRYYELVDAYNNATSKKQEIEENTNADE